MVNQPCVPISRKLHPRTDLPWPYGFLAGTVFGCLNSPDSSGVDSSGPLELHVEPDSSCFKTGVPNPALEDRSPAGLSVLLSPEVPLSLEKALSVW